MGLATGCGKHTSAGTTGAVNNSTKSLSCHPLSSKGNCYEPGEFCSKAEHSMSGVSGNGQSIKCEDKNGSWRWETV